MKIMVLLLIKLWAWLPFMFLGALTILVPIYIKAPWQWWHGMIYMVVIFYAYKWLFPEEAWRYKIFEKRFTDYL